MKTHSTTILTVRKDDCVAIGGGAGYSGRW